MLSKQNILTLILLLFVTMATVAEDGVKLRGCRRGKINTSAINRRASNMPRQTRAASDNPYIGERHQLVVLAAYKDRTFEGDSAATMQKWNNILNQEGYNESSFVGSVHDYFYDQSYGKFNLTFDIQYVQLSDSCSKYASNDYDDENSQFLVQDVVGVLLKRNIDWSLYDWSGDGYVNQLLIIYAGKGMNDGGDDTTIWPHQWWLSSHIIPGSDKEYCSPITATYGGQNYVVDCYCAVHELGVSNNSFGTICHEYSHCFGFPDFYSGSKKYVGKWDLMDYGNYNGGGYVPCGYSAHERMLMGWLEPSELTEATTVSYMSSLNEVGEAYLIRNDGYGDEYFFIENRKQEGWDQYIPGSGILVFHIDYDPEIWVSTTESPNHPEYTDYKTGISYPKKERYIVFDPKNSYTYGWPYPYNGNSELTNTSSPAASLWHANTDDSYFMNKSITDMSVTDGKASFTFSPTPTAIREMKYNSQAQDVYYNLAGQRISDPQKGVYIFNGKKYIK